MPNEPFSVPAPPPVPIWKGGVVKSSAPFKRSLSSSAAQLVKGPVGKGVNARYDALNTTNKNTIEFRMFKGTMNGSSILRYLEFVDALVRFVANTTATDEGVSYQTFVKWLKGDSFNVIRYEHLVSFITEQGFLDRKEIRRKTLPKVVSQDKDVTGLTAAIAQGFVDAETDKPLGVFNTTRGEGVEPPAVSQDEADEAYDVLSGYVDEPVYPDEPPCDCPECCEMRGED